MYNMSILDFKQVWSFVFKPRRISPTNPTWHPLRIKLPTEISKIPNNSFSIRSPMKSDNDFEKIDQRSVCSHYALYASLH
jgi:hypothetical protein